MGYSKIKVGVLLLLCTATLHFRSLGQTTDYSLPADLEKNISKADYKIIADLSIAAVAKKYKIDHVSQGTITLGKGQNMAAFNLDNVLLQCEAEKDHSKWNGIIQAHFDRLFNSIDKHEKTDLSGYDKVKGNLSIRIYTAASAEQRGGLENLVSRVDLEGTVTLLMLDLPEAFATVSKKEFDHWHISADTAFRQALENIGKQKIERETKSIDIEGTPVEFNFLENEDYAASYALDLSNNSPALVGEWGSAIALPNKGLVAICKISREKPVEFVKFIQAAKPIIEKLYTSDPQPISKEFFWYYKGKFTRIVVNEDSKGNINVIAPVGLSELMVSKK